MRLYGSKRVSSRFLVQCYVRGPVCAASLRDLRLACDEVGTKKYPHTHTEFVLYAPQTENERSHGQVHKNNNSIILILILI